MSKREGIFDGSVNVTFGCQMNDTINLLILHQLQHTVKVTDVHLDKLVVRFVFNVFEVGQITGIS